MKISPLFDQVVLRKLKSKKVSQGGIVLPEIVDETTHGVECEVIATGRGRVTEEGRRIEPEVRRGDKVVIGKYAGALVQVDGEEMLIVREGEILGVIE